MESKDATAAFWTMQYSMAWAKADSRLVDTFACIFRLWNTVVPPQAVSASNPNLVGFALSAYGPVAPLTKPEDTAHRIRAVNDWMVPAGRVR